jgi:hypothetical protein
MTSSYKKKSMRVEAPSPCCFIDPRQQWKPNEQKPCGQPAFNVTQSGHNQYGIPYLNSYCDYHEQERLA